nr:hypothetical protein [Vibrio amylolyticus]
MGVHLSPEIKAGNLFGAGLQIGATDVGKLAALYLSYNQMSYDDTVYDHSSKSYRIGMQKMYGHDSRMGFQVEIGGAQYVGTRDLWNGPQHRKSNGLSLGGAYVYQASNSIALRGGVDFNTYGMGNAYFAYGVQPSFSLGVIFNL